MSATLEIILSALAVALIAFGGGYITHRFIDAAQFETLLAQFDAYKAANSAAAAEQLRQQVRDLQAASALNAKALGDLQSENTGLAAHYNDLARRLLATPACPGASPQHLPEAAGRQAPPAAGADPSAGSARQALLGRTLAECRANANQLNELESVVTPQVTVQ